MNSKLIMIMQMAVTVRRSGALMASAMAWAPTVAAFVESDNCCRKSETSQLSTAHIQGILC